MIYYNNVLVNYNKQDTQEARRVYQEITDIKNKYFSEKGIGKLVLLYPKGAPVERDKGWTQLKKFMIPLKSRDGRWRYTSSIRNAEKKANSGYSDHHFPVHHETTFFEKDIEFIWFLMNESAVIGRDLYFEDKEADARKEIEEMATDIDIQFMLMSPHSPIYKNEPLIREVASVFGVENVDKIGISQVKKELYETLKEGNEYGDRYVNYDTFDKLVNGEKARKAASVARNAIESNIVGYKSNAWWIMEGRTHGEKLVAVPASEGASRDQVLIQAVVENDNVRNRLFSAMGENENITLEDLRALDRPLLQKRYRELTGKFLNSKKEEIIAELCNEYDLEYSPLTE